MDKEAMADKIRVLRAEITTLNEVLRKKNLALAALGWVWCSGGCLGGVRLHSWLDECPLTSEQVSIVERNTIRLRSWYENRRCIEARKAGEKLGRCDDCRASCFPEGTRGAVDLTGEV